MRLRPVLRAAGRSMIIDWILLGVMIVLFLAGLFDLIFGTPENGHGGLWL